MASNFACKQRSGSFFVTQCRSGVSISEPSSLCFLLLPPCLSTSAAAGVRFMYHWRFVKKRGCVFIRKEETSIKGPLCGRHIGKHHFRSALGPGRCPRSTPMQMQQSFHLASQVLGLQAMSSSNLPFQKITFMYVCLCMCACARMHDTAHVWWSEDNSQELALSPRSGTQVNRHLYPLSHFAGL